MAEFTVQGPFKLEVRKPPAGGRRIHPDGFWGAAGLSGIRDACGVYVFAIKPPRTTVYTPCYVGKATGSFTEALTNDKLHKYDNALGEYKSGAPVLFFLQHPKGKKNHTQIGQVEEYLIMMGFAVNPEIQNDKGAKLPDWEIRGVVRGGTKKPSKAAKHLSSMFAIKSRKGV